MNTPTPAPSAHAIKDTPPNQWPCWAWCIQCAEWHKIECAEYMVHEWYSHWSPSKTKPEHAPSQPRQAGLWARVNEAISNGVNAGEITVSEECSAYGHAFVNRLIAALTLPPGAEQVASPGAVEQAVEFHMPTPGLPDGHYSGPITSVKLDPRKHGVIDSTIAPGFHPVPRSQHELRRHLTPASVAKPGDGSEEEPGAILSEDVTPEAVERAKNHVATVYANWESAFPDEKLRIALTEVARLLYGVLPSHRDRKDKAIADWVAVADKERVRAEEAEARLATATPRSSAGDGATDAEGRVTEAIHEASTLTYADSRKLARAAIAAMQPRTEPGATGEREGEKS